MIVLYFIYYILWCFVYVINKMNLNIECEWFLENYLVYLKIII